MKLKFWRRKPKHDRAVKHALQKWNDMTYVGDFGLSEPDLVQPEIRWEPIDIDGWIGVRAMHDGPCVFIDRQCSCGMLDIGVHPGS